MPDFVVSWIVIGLIIALAALGVRLLVRKIRKTGVRLPQNRKPVVSLAVVFLSFVFLQITCLTFDIFEGFYLWFVLSVAMVVSAVCFLILSRLAEAKNLFLVLLVSTIRGFFTGWVLSWILMLAMLMMNQVKGDSGGGYGIGALVLLVLTTAVGFWIGIFKIIVRIAAKY